MNGGVSGYEYSMIHAELLIDGHFIGGPCDQATGKAVIRNPYNGAIVGTAAEGGPHELRGCLDAAWDAYQTWRFSSIAERQALLRRIASLVRERRDELVDLLVAEVGKPLMWARGEVDRLAITFEIASQELEDWGEEEVSLPLDPRGKDYTASVSRFPIGPVLCIVPYNWPFNLAAHKLAPALAVGNTVILKASPLAPLCTLALARLIHDAGCPHGVVNAWNGPTPLISKISTDPRCRMVSFTGSPAVGWKVKQELPPEKKVTLELGGNGFAVISDSADIEWASKRCVAGGYGYAGQVCIAVQHVLIAENIYDAVRDNFVRMTNDCVWGDPQNESTVCGPMISNEAADRVQDWIDEAVSSGAGIIAGGGREENIIKPTLLENLPKNVRLSNEEVFGPVVTLEKYHRFDEVVERINGGKYGIHAGIFTNDADERLMAYQNLEVGGIVFNDYPTLRFDGLPYGGTKLSGFGREGVRYAMEEMTDWKSKVTRQA